MSLNNNDLSPLSMRPTHSTFPRAARSVVERAGRAMPVVVLRGPRQSGKSTLAAELAGEQGREIVTFDDPESAIQFQANQDRFVRRDAPMVFDEVQREPQVMLALKRAVDAMGTRRKPGHYLVTGSADLLLMRQVEDSLTGRAAYVNLWPMTCAELRGEGRAGRWDILWEHPVAEWARLLDGDEHQTDWRHAVRRGGFPTPALASDPAVKEAWPQAYIETFLNRDLRDLADLGATVDFHRVMKAAAARVGSLVNQSQIGVDVQLPQPRVRSYLNLMEISFQIVRLEAYLWGQRHRLIKSPKLYWNDPALGMFMGGRHEPAGADFENLVMIDLLTWKQSQLNRPDLAYWRTTTGHEVDFVVSTPQRVLPIEVKTSRDVGYSDIKGMHAFLDAYDSQCPGGVVLYDGTTVKSLTPRILAVPWWKVL